MKGVGQVTGWKVERRGANDIEWKQTRGKRTAAMWKVWLGSGKIMYELTTERGKVRTFKGCRQPQPCARSRETAHGITPGKMSRTATRRRDDAGGGGGWKEKEVISCQKQH